MRTIRIEGAKSVDDQKNMTVDSPPVTPIVFVPGVMGSRLSFKGVDWDPDSKLNMVAWSGLDPIDAAGYLDVRGGDKAVPMHAAMPPDPRLDPIQKELGQPDNFYGQTRGWDGVAKTYYYELLVSLETFFARFPFECGAHPVYAFAYDWRRSNAETGAELAKKIKSVSDDNGGAKVVLVTHSMGGLVARYAVHPKVDGNAADKVKGVVHVMQPVNGATQSYRRFAEGVWLDRFGTFPDGVVLAGILGGSWWGYTFIMSGTDGPVQLLPNQAFGDWLVDGTGALVPSSNIYSFYSSGKIQSLVPDLSKNFARMLSFRRLGDADDTLEAVGEDVGVVFGGPVAAYEVMEARTKRVQDRWNEYRDKLRTGLRRAEEFHTRVIGTAHPRTFMLYAADHKTEVGYDWSQDEGDRVVEDEPGGDGTVPAQSARALDALVAKAWKRKLPDVLYAHQNVGAQEHTAVFNDKAVLDRVNLLVFYLIRLEKAAEGVPDECVVSSFEIACEHKVKRKLTLKLPAKKDAKPPSNVLEVVAGSSKHTETLTTTIALSKPRCDKHQDEMLQIRRNAGERKVEKLSDASGTAEVYFDDVPIRDRFPAWLWPWDVKPITYTLTPQACHPSGVGAVVRVFPEVEPSVEFEFELDTDERVGEQMKKSRELGRVEKRGRPANTEWKLTLKAKAKYAGHTVELSAEIEGKIRKLAAVNALVKKGIDKFSGLFFKFTGVTLLPLFPKLSLNYEGKFKEIDNSCRVGAEWSFSFKADPLIGITAKIEILAVLIKAIQKIPVLTAVGVGLEKIRIWAEENDQTFEIYLLFSGLISGEVGGKKKAEDQKPGFFGSIEGKLKAEFIAKASFGTKGIISFQLGAKVEAGTGLYAKLEADHDERGPFLNGSWGACACKFKYCAWASGKVIWEVKESVEGEYTFWKETEFGKTDDWHILAGKEGKESTETE
jgi:pimeloyl-ACP methyl ester carboxylesterase